MDTIDLRSPPEGGFIAGVTGFRITYDPDSSLFGKTVSSIGDINGDGIEDFAISAPFASPNGLSAAGEIIIIFGRNSSQTSWDNIRLGTSDEGFITGTTGFKIFGGSVGDNLGSAVSALG